MIYLSHIRLNILYAMSTISRFKQIPYKEHMETVNRIMRYLKATLGKRVKFRKTNKRCIEAYTDLTGQSLSMIENLPLVIVLLCGTISLLGEVRSKRLLSGAVLKMSTKS